MLQHFPSDKIICGVDEAGRGCLAGPVVAAAVILPKNFTHEFLNDSKQLSEIQRNELRPIIEKNAIAFGVGIIDNNKIDEVNILQATYLAMHEAIAQIKQKIDLLIIDGNRFKPYKNIAHQTIIKGDGKYIEIAAASILAKTYRDEIMEKLHIEFPEYHWHKNKAYPTIEHRKAIKEFGMFGDDI
ncbi:MAG TPA: ribonuclease HII, partial [Chitinophagales bacterium]|nr:ribonuclease HII [Chitinophagales bacterium]